MIKNGFYSTSGADGAGRTWNFILTVRGTGKSWALKLRAMCRFFKGKGKTLWVRSSTAETMNQREGFLPSSLLDLIPQKYHLERSKLQVTKRGVFYGGEEVIRFCTLSLQSANKGAGGVEDFTEIVYDEFMMIHEYRYRGDRSADLVNLFTTYNRGKPVRVWCLGNRETHSSPIFRHFHIPETIGDRPTGIYCGKSWVVEIIAEANETSTKMNESLSESDGAYLFNGKVRGDNERLRKFTTRHITPEFSTYIKGVRLVWGCDRKGHFGAVRGLNTTVPIYTDTTVPREWGYSVDIRFNDFPNREYLMRRCGFDPPYFYDEGVREVGLDVLFTLSYSRFR